LRPFVLKAFDRLEAGRDLAVADAGQMQDDGFRKRDVVYNSSSNSDRLFEEST